MTETTTTGLVPWLIVQIAEDERALRSWDGSCFHIEACDDGWEAFSDRYPADRMLAECDAKRRIVEIHESEDVDGRLTDGEDITVPCCVVCRDSNGMREEEPCPTLRLLALPYSGRPGYRPEWRPE